MSTIRIAFLGTPLFARLHLEALLEDEHFEVVGVVSQPDRPSGRHMHLAPSPVKELALKKQLRVITPESIRDISVIKEISTWRAEAAVVVAYGQIVPQAFLDLFPFKVVNVHGSLLPRWRGAAPIQRAIQQGDKMSGVSLQIMVKKLDAGDVIGSYTLPIHPKMNALDLHDAMVPLGIKLLTVDFMDYLRGHLMPTPQNEGLVTYAHKIEKEEARINWDQSAESVCNHISAMVMGPGSFCEWNGKKLKILRACLVDGEGQAQKPGTVLNATDSLQVQCQKGVIEILELQPESRARMLVKDFLLGHKVVVGDRF